MREEKLTGLLSKWGCFQTRLFAMMTWPIMFKGFQTMLAVVILAVPLHRCRVPGLHNDTYTIQSDSHRALVNASIPVNQHSDPHQEPLYDRCKIYVNSSDHVTGSDVSVTLEEVEEYRYQQEQEEEDRQQPKSMACSDWVYDDSYFESTVITQFHLVCEQKVYRAHFSMIYMVGGIVSGLTSGFISDWMGRKKCFFMAVTVNIVAGTLATFPQHPLLFLLYRFFIGISGYAIYLTFYIIGIEFVGPEYRNFAGTLGCLQWMLGTFLLTGVSFLIRQWYILQLLSSLPLVVCFVFWRYLPESPRWLMSKGKTEEAMDVLKTLARVNRLPFPQGLDDTEGQENPEEKEKEEEDKQQKKRLGLRQVLNFPVLIVRGLILVFIWFALGMTYYGISINVTNLFGNAHVNFLISNTVEAIGYLLCWFLADRIGRTRLYCVAMVMSGTFCSSTIFTVLFLDEENQWATTVLALAGKLGACAAFSVVYLMTSEMLPTVIRHTGLGCFQLSCRLGSAISPYIADLVFVIEGEFGQALPFILFGVMAVTAGLLSLLLPETLRCPLPDTLEEAAKIGKRVTVPAEHGIEMNGITDQGSSLMNGKEE